MQFSLTEHTEIKQRYSELIQQIGIHMFRRFL
jgi:hypothetical protein